jgi:hypothetical protein
VIPRQGCARFIESAEKHRTAAEGEISQFRRGVPATIRQAGDVASIAQQRLLLAC